MFTKDSPELRCPISKEFFFNPVNTPSGQNFEEELIKKQLKNEKNCPITKQALSDSNLNPNLFALNAVLGCVNSAIKEGDLSIIDEIYFPADSSISAIENKDLSKLDMLLRRDQLLLTDAIPTRFLTKKLNEQTYKCTAFHLACSLGSKEIIKYFFDLIKKQPEEVQQSIIVLQPENWNPEALNRVLLDAVKENNAETVNFCLKFGANINCVDRTESNSTPLHLAAKHGRFEIAKLLLSKKPNLEALAADKSSPLNFAAHYGQVEVLCLLLRAGANVLHQDEEGNTPLHDAFSPRNVENKLNCAKLLIEYGASKHIENKAGNSPLGSYLATKEQREFAATQLYGHSFFIKQARKQEMEQKIEELKQEIAKLQSNSNCP